MLGSRYLISITFSILLLVLSLSMNGCNLVEPESDYRRVDSESIEIKLAADVTVKQLCDDIWLHTTWHSLNGSRPYPANGIVAIDSGSALVVDTPWTDRQMQVLAEWIKTSLKSEISYVVPTHWHIDCAGGLEEAHKLGAESITYGRTIEIMREKGLANPHSGFKENRSIKFGRRLAELYYPGPGHSEDNIVVYLPHCKLLFGGCMVKNSGARNLGNITEADLDKWPKSLGQTKERFHDAELVIPGHGQYGGLELIEHSINLLENNNTNAN